MSASESEIKSIYAVFGPDAFLKAESLRNLLDSIARQAGVVDGPVRYDGSEAELPTVLDDVRTYSLFGGRRIVVVDEADEFISTHRAALEKYCSAPADSGTLVLVCNSLPASTRIHKIIARTGRLIACPAVKGAAVNAWIQQRAQAAYGKRMDARAALLLRELAGTSLAALDAELNKLATFVRDRGQITSADVEALVGRHRQEDIFGIIDAIESGDTGKALAQWERVLATDRAAPARAIGGLAWGLRRLLDMKAQADRGVSIHALARQAFTQPDVLRSRLGRLNVEVIRQQLCDLLDADLAAKTGLSTVPSAVEVFIVRHSATGRPGKRTA